MQTDDSYGRTLMMLECLRENRETFN